ncbi:MAG: hypothetical protein HYX24_07465 [Candidatus Aenigmarchaeota archaeon]|nr:hypothetical protein [Candidatus Aenigmarchaeota archaeon]
MVSSKFRWLEQLAKQQFDEIEKESELALVKATGSRLGKPYESLSYLAEVDRLNSDDQFIPAYHPDLCDRQAYRRYFRRIDLVPADIMKTADFCRFPVFTNQTVKDLGIISA